MWNVNNYDFYASIISKTENFWFPLCKNFCGYSKNLLSIINFLLLIFKD